VRGLPKEIPLPLFDHAGSFRVASRHAALRACGERLPHT
jgi:hypothetical protein